MSHSQYGEEEIILQTLGDISGRKILDIGAYDGKTFSNSLALIEGGCEAVLVEASPHAFDSLRKNLDQYIRSGQVSAVCAAVGFDRHIAKFYECADAVSTLSDAEREKWSKDNAEKFWPIYVPIVTIGDILNQFSGPFSFVNIDIEGQSAELLMSFPIDAMRPICFCVEHDNRSVELAEYMHKHGYDVCHMNGTNVIFRIK